MFDVRLRTVRERKYLIEAPDEASASATALREPQTFVDEGPEEVVVGRVRPLPTPPRAAPPAPAPPARTPPTNPTPTRSRGQATL